MFEFLDWSRRFCDDMFICQFDLPRAKMRRRGDDHGWWQFPGELEHGSGLASRTDEGKAGSWLHAESFGKRETHVRDYTSSIIMRSQGTV